MRMVNYCPLAKKNWSRGVAAKHAALSRPRSRVRIPSGPQRVTSYPQSNLLALSEKLTERQLRLTGGEHLMVTKKFRTSELQQMNLLTIQEVANWAKVSTKTIYRWISDNKIPAIRLGNRTYRIPEQAIIDYLKQNGFDHLVS
jgi:excisionase family DNA binding protein